jgi:putative PIN family toxin of toxin-antitoxin system
MAVRVMLDTNVLISALLFPGERMNALMYKAAVENRLVLSSFVLYELLEVTRRKFPEKLTAVDAFLSRLPYELVYTPENPAPGLFEIRDANDYPVLYSAIVEDVDIFVTGDKDFTDLNLGRPAIMTPASFLEIK